MGNKWNYSHPTDFDRVAYFNSDDFNILEQQDIKAFFSKVIREIPNEWFECFTHYYTNQGYSLANNLIRCYNKVSIGQ